MHPIKMLAHTPETGNRVLSRRRAASRLRTARGLGRCIICQGADGPQRARGTYKFASNPLARFHVVDLHSGHCLVPKILVHHPSH